MGCEGIIPQAIGVLIRPKAMSPPVGDVIAEVVAKTQVPLAIGEDVIDRESVRGKLREDLRGDANSNGFCQFGSISAGACDFFDEINVKQSVHTDILQRLQVKSVGKRKNFPDSGNLGCRTWHSLTGAIACKADAVMPACFLRKIVR